MENEKSKNIKKSGNKTANKTANKNKKTNNTVASEKNAIKVAVKKTAKNNRSQSVKSKNAKTEKAENNNIEQKVIAKVPNRTINKSNNSLKIKNITGVEKVSSKSNFKKTNNYKKKNNFKNKTQKTEKSFFIKSIPTLISLLALCLAITAIKISFAGNFSLAAILTLIACFLDGVDGRVARKLGVSGGFGMEMDSLADMVNFGVAPGFVLYFWKMHELQCGFLSWFAVLLLACCMAIRLARFNVATGAKNQDNPLIKYFFVGMPAPAVASLMMFPPVLTFQFGEGFWSAPLFVTLYNIMLALLAASKVPTPCFKKIKIADKLKKPLLISVILYLLLLTFEIWLALSLLGTLYILSIFVGIRFYLNFKKNSR